MRGPHRELTDGPSAPWWVAMVAAAVTCTVGVATTTVSVRAQQPAAGPRWVTAWSTSHQIRAEPAISNATVRFMARVTIPGDTIRLRFDNTLGTEPLRIGRAFVGHRVRGALLAAGSNRPLTFSGAAEATIAPGATAWSDPVAFPVLAQQDLAVSLYIPGQRVAPTQHTGAVVTSYRTADGGGDVTADESGTPFTGTVTSLWWLKSIEVQASASSGAIAVFGDSITDGTCTTLDAHDRWENLLSVRLGLEHDAAVRAGLGAVERWRAVLNEGIGGNTLTREGLNPGPDSPTGVERLERDVLSHHGVDTVVLFMGTNDIRRGASASQVIAAMTTIAQRVRAAGIRVIGVTIIPRHNVPAVPGNSGWDTGKTRIRNEVNAWIRSRAVFDAVIDFDRVVADVSNPDLIRPAFNCGDGIHPSPRGYFEMGSALDLALFAPR